ncbi:DUF2079 domain-containing protein [Streptomyces sp. NPDC047022]|uniref:DUF2079 domain-containing protein n=1 Tax=Streptomyces sp. NPDC047022 TaxID=3155737 RepID=UPI0033C239BA
MQSGTRVWWAWAAGLFVLYALFSLAQHHRLGTTGYDLGIFTQAVRGYAHFGAPTADLKGWGYNLYGDHFHPILVLLVPLYWIWPNAQTLLVAQAALVAVAAVPLARLAADRGGRPAGHATAAAYGLSFGVQGAVAFDFHEVAFAAPLLAFGLAALSERRSKAAAAWALPLLLVKEELALMVAVIGAILAWRGARRLGLALIAISVSVFALVVGVLIPAFNPQGVYPYMNNASAGGSLSSSRSIFSRLADAPELLFSPSQKIVTLLLLGALTCFLALRSPLIAIALPNIAVRFLSDSPAYWGTGLQYNLPLMPVLIAAAWDAQPAWAHSRIPLARGLARRAGAALLCAAAPLAPTQPLQDFLLHPVRAFSTDAHAKAAYALMRRIPDGAAVEATNHLSPHLAHRTRVFTWPLVDHTPDWVILDVNEYWPTSFQENQAHLTDLLHHGYRQVDAQDGIFLLHRE